MTHIHDAVRDALEREAVRAGSHQEAAVPLPSGWAVAGASAASVAREDSVITHGL